MHHTSKYTSATPVQPGRVNTKRQVRPRMAVRTVNNTMMTNCARDDCGQYSYSVSSSVTASVESTQFYELFEPLPPVQLHVQVSSNSQPDLPTLQASSSSQPDLPTLQGLTEREKNDRLTEVTQQHVYDARDRARKESQMDSTSDRLIHRRIHRNESQLDAMRAVDRLEQDKLQQPHHNVKVTAMSWIRPLLMIPASGQKTYVGSAGFSHVGLRQFHLILLYIFLLIYFFLLLICLTIPCSILIYFLDIYLVPARWLVEVLYLFLYCNVIIDLEIIEYMSLFISLIYGLSIAFYFFYITTFTISVFIILVISFAGNFIYYMLKCHFY